MNEISTMRRLTILCPILTLVIVTAMLGYQLHLRAAARAEVERRQADYNVLLERFHRAAPNVAVLHHEHEPGDADDH